MIKFHIKISQAKFTEQLLLTKERNKVLFQRHYGVYIILSHKLRCYTGISGPEKSRNNTREKISFFFTCVDIANQLLTRHSPLAPLGQVDE